MVRTDRLREAMVGEQIAARGVRDPAVLEALREVPREAFLPEELGELAYLDAPQPIGCEQTISQPYVVAWMTEALELTPDARVLEVGTGSGYAAAVLARVARQVFTIERHAPLARQARANLARAGVRNAKVRHGDGTLGWPEEAPFDGIVVAAAGPDVPRPLVAQLAVGGRLVVPIGEARGEQRLVRVTRVAEDRTKIEDLGEVRFVPLIGEAGFEARAARTTEAERARGETAAGDELGGRDE